MVLRYLEIPYVLQSCLLRSYVNFYGRFFPWILNDLLSMDLKIKFFLLFISICDNGCNVDLSLHFGFEFLAILSDEPGNSILKYNVYVFR